jgi:Zn-dependent peptidase ImmA (M78 family)
MTLRRGFKKEANDYAKELRLELGINPHEPLSPWELAKHLGIPVSPLSEFGNENPKAVKYLKEKNQDCFSAITVFDGSRRLIVHNDAHHPYRQAANIAHELSHGILGHPATEVFNEIGCRNFNTEIEEEANWLGPALLISEEAALYIAKHQMSVDEASEYYCASKQVVNMRVNATNAYVRVQRSQKNR